MYGWTYEQIVSHNKYQLWNALKGYVPDSITFRTHEEYLAWKLANGK